MTLPVAPDPAFALLDAIPEPAYVWRRAADGVVRLAAWNAAAVRATEGRIAQFGGVAMDTFFAHEPSVVRAIERVMDDGVPIEKEHEYVMRTTGRRSTMSTTYMRHDAHTVLIHARDVTERQAAAARLRESEECFRGAFEQSTTGMSLTAFDGTFLRVNTALCTMLGRTRQELVGTTFMSLTHPDDLSRNVDLRERLLRGEIPSYQMEKRFLHRDGRVVWVELNVSAVCNDEGQPQYMVAQMVDVSDRRATEAALRDREQQLRQSQKMEAVGRLAGGIAHDFNNLLTAIGGHAELLADALAPSDPRRADVDEVQRAATRAAQLTRQLLAFSRRQIIAPQDVDLHKAVDGVLPMVRRLIGEDIRIARQRDGGPAAVLADPSQLEQVVVNLALNARDAMSGGGTLTIATVATPDGGSLVVRDTGVGMDDAVRERIFEPFFTTKPQGAGTGLGLSTVYGIVEQGGGRIAVESAPGRGATFRIDLPRRATAPEAMTAGARGDAVARSEGVARDVPDADVAGTGTVLLVEDEPAVRAVARRTLQRAGFRVVEAHDGVAALEQALAPGVHLDLVLTDVVMPRMSGRELAERLAEARPTLPVLFMSGYTDDEIVRRGVQLEGHAFVQKPFRPADLVLAVRRALEAAAAA